MTAIQKYLDLYAEIESKSLHQFPQRFRRGLVIPMYREDFSALEKFCRFIENNRGTLLILILNRPDTNNDINWHKPFSNYFSSQSTIWQANNLKLISCHNESGILVVDRCIEGQPIPADQGVGLARKIGADILCQLINQKLIKSSWIANTDADVFLPENYFDILEKQKASAVIFPYQHIFSNDHEPKLPTLLYEFSLHYYVEGLRQAGSQYSYQTIGSIITIHYKDYAKVRGFPKRSGGEDFYLLNKMAKIGNIVSLKEPTINIQSRMSDRVPFGTGPAVSTLNNSENPLTAQLYHPRSFDYLKVFIRLLETIANYPSTSTPTLKQAFDLIMDQDNVSTVIEYQQLYIVAEKIGTQKAINHCFNNAKTSSSRKKHLVTWFDGFKTLKLIHHLRDDTLGTISYQMLFDKKYYFEFSQSMRTIYSKIKNETNT